MERQFSFDQPLGVFPALLERLRGTPARAAELTLGFTDQGLANRIGKAWSAKEHLAHLNDLQPLDDQRLREFLDHVPVLSAADVTNRTTESANHRDTPISEILRRLRAGRSELVARLEALTPDELAIRSVHPRLRQPMRVLDWLYFVAEHDDHHLAKARLAASRISRD